MTEDEMVGWHHQLNGHELEQALSRDIALPTKVCLVKATVFPVVMYGCESWTVKKAECQRIDDLNCGVREGF